jgi:acid stress-induced BolA-like protein IbaG/YrbA
MPPGEGGVTVMTADEIARRIEAALPGSRAEVTGEDAHFSAVVSAPSFAGRSRIEQHKMIYDLFRDEMASEAIHALALRTTAPRGD